MYTYTYVWSLPCCTVMIPQGGILPTHNSLHIPYKWHAFKKWYLPGNVKVEFWTNSNSPSVTVATMLWMICSESLLAIRGKTNVLMTHDLWNNIMPLHCHWYWWIKTLSRSRVPWSLNRTSLPYKNGDNVNLITEIPAVLQDNYSH